MKNLTRQLGAFYPVSGWWLSWTGGSSSSTYFEKARWTTSYSSTLAHGGDTWRFGWWIWVRLLRRWCVDATTTASEELRTEKGGLGVFLLVDVFCFCWVLYTIFADVFFFKPISPGCEKGFVPLNKGQKGFVKHTPRSEVWFQNQLRSGLHWILDVEASVFVVVFFWHNDDSSQLFWKFKQVLHHSRACFKCCRIEKQISMFGITCENPDFLHNWTTPGDVPQLQSLFGREANTPSPNIFHSSGCFFKGTLWKTKIAMENHHF